MDRSIKIVRGLEEVFEPYCILFKELNGKEKKKKKKKRQLSSQCSCKGKRTQKNTKVVFFGGRSIICGFSLFETGLGI